jgi:hypothetical protein
LTLYLKVAGSSSFFAIVVVVVIISLLEVVRDDDEYCASASPTIANAIPVRTLVFSGSVSKCCLYMDSAPWNTFVESAAAAARTEEEENVGSKM